MHQIQRAVEAVRALGLTPAEFGRAVGFAAGAFVVLGTVAALWGNPIFVRMTPTSGFEIALLAVQSVLLGLYLGIRRRVCAAKKAGLGGVLGYLGIACPVCNKILLFMFGSSLLLTYFEPIRLYVGLAGVALTMVALWQKVFAQFSDATEKESVPDFT